MKTKIDFHTHCLESTGDPVPKLSTARKIIAQIKKRGLDGIAITDHDNKDYGFRMKEAIGLCSSNDVIIIPGQEVSLHKQHVVELFLSNSSVFRFCAHPLFGDSFEDFINREGDNIHGIEIKNGAWQLQEDKIKELAEKYNLILLENSDAHSISEIGLHYNTVDLEELKSHCQ